MSLSRLLQLQEYISDKWTQKICGIEKWKIWNIFCWQLLSWKSKHTDRTTLMHPTARSRSACLCCRLTNIAVNALMSATLRKRWCEDLAVGSHLKFQLRWCDDKLQLQKNIEIPLEMVSIRCWEGFYHASFEHFVDCHNVSWLESFPRLIKINNLFLLLLFM